MYKKREPTAAVHLLEFNRLTNLGLSDIVKRSICDQNVCQSVVSWGEISVLNLWVLHEQCVKKKHPPVDCENWTNIRRMSERMQDGGQVTRRKWHMCFPLVPKLVILNDLEQRNDRYLKIYFALFRRIQ